MQPPKAEMPMSDTDELEGAVEHETVEQEIQVAFDVDDFPGGMRARPRGGPHGRRRAGPGRRCSPPRWSSRSRTSRRRCTPWRPTTPATRAASRCAGSPAAGGSTAAPTTPRSWRSSSSTGSRPSCPRPRWRPLPSSPTASPSPGRGSSAVRGVNVDGVVRTLLTRGLIEEVGRGRALGGDPLRHDRVLPRTARPRHPRRPAGARAVPARGRCPRRAGRAGALVTPAPPP